MALRAAGMLSSPFYRIIGNEQMNAQRRRIKGGLNAAEMQGFPALRRRSQRRNRRIL
jgi:hypothetical protein